MDALLRQLALEIVHDGEGARRVGPRRRDAAARTPSSRSPASVANSPLVKSALHGGDPNFGRILQAAGQVWPPGEPFIVDLEIEGHQVVSAGDVVEPAPAELVQGDEVEYVLTCPARAARPRSSSATSAPSTCSFNAEYTS